MTINLAPLGPSLITPFMNPVGSPDSFAQFKTFTFIIIKFNFPCLKFINVFLQLYPFTVKHLQRAHHQYAGGAKCLLRALIALELPAYERVPIIFYEPLLTSQNCQPSGFSPKHGGKSCQLYMTKLWMSNWQILLSKRARLLYSSIYYLINFQHTVLYFDVSNSTIKHQIKAQPQQNSQFLQNGCMQCTMDIKGSQTTSISVPVHSLARRCLPNGYMNLQVTASGTIAVMHWEVMCKGSLVA